MLLPFHTLEAQRPQNTNALTDDPPHPHPIHASHPPKHCTVAYNTGAACDNAMEVASVGEDGGALIWRGEVRVCSFVLFVAASLFLHLEEARETCARPLCAVVAGGLCLHYMHTHAYYMCIFMCVCLCVFGIPPSPLA